MDKEKNTLEELFTNELPPEAPKIRYEEKIYSGWAVVKKTPMSLRSCVDGKMPIYWDKKLAEDNIGAGQEVVRCELNVWRPKN